MIEQVREGPSGAAGASPPGPAALRGVDRVAGWASAVLAALGGAALAGLALLICTDVVMRAMGNPLRGVVEIAASTVVAAAFLLMPFAMRKRGHVRSTIIRNRLPRPVARGIDVATFLLGALVFALIVEASWELVLRAYLTGEYTGEGALRVPALPSRLALLIGSTVMIVECLLAAAWSLLRDDEEVDEVEGGQGA